MKLIASLPSVAALLLIASPALAGPPGPSVARKEGLGRYLVDGTGQTLYTFRKDSPGRSACEGECVTRWPIYLNDGGAPVGVKPEDLGTITRPDGKKQTTYKGMPLYYFAGDAAAGETRGHGLKEAWYVVAP
jgi:predicted lipoprotein with Yx(FWY)xxD motif